MTDAANEQVCRHDLIEETGWWQALNPAIYLVSVLPLFGVILLADTSFWLHGVVLATAGVILLQHAINLFNDISDWQLGADVNKRDSWVRVFQGDTRPVLQQAVISAIIGITLGVTVLVVSGKYWLLLVASPMVILGYLYNAGSQPLSYTSLGEWVTGLCYGPGVFGCLYLLAVDELTPRLLLGMITFACMAMALLLSHQPPQIDTDRAAGKQSFAVRYGETTTIWTARYLLLTAFMAFVGALWLSGNWLVTLVFILFAIAAVVFSFATVPKPKTLLLSSSSIFIGALLAKIVTVAS